MWGGEWQLHKGILQLFHSRQDWSRSARRPEQKQIWGLELGPSLCPISPAGILGVSQGSAAGRQCAKKSQRFSLEEAFRESFSREDISKQFQIIFLQATLGETEVTSRSSWFPPACSELIAVTLVDHMHVRKIMTYSHSHLKRNKLWS